MELKAMMQLGWWQKDARRWLALLAVGVGSLIVASFILQYGFDMRPCPMCWWQRYLHWVITALAVLGVVVVRGSRTARMIGSGIAAAALAGLAVAVWQFLAQQGWLPFPPTCTSHGGEALVMGGDLLTAMAATEIVPCDVETSTILGLSLAGWNIFAMLGVLMVVALGVMGLKRK